MRGHMMSNHACCLVEGALESEYSIPSLTVADDLNRPLSFCAAVLKCQEFAAR